MSRNSAPVSDSNHGSICRSGFLLWVMLLILLAGCSNRQIYTSIQLNRQFECSKLPVAEQEDCFEEHSKSYDSYKRARDEAVEGS